MRDDDSSNYNSWKKQEDSTYYNVWNFGKEVWCNLEGRYMHIVADLAHLELEYYEMVLC